VQCRGSSGTKSRKKSKDSKHWASSAGALAPRLGSAHKEKGMRKLGRFASRPARRPPSPIKQPRVQLDEELQQAMARLREFEGTTGKSNLSVTEAAVDVDSACQTPATEAEAKAKARNMPQENETLDDAVEHAGALG
jgi:hypothetical protein